MESTVLHENRCHGTSALVKSRLYYDTLCAAVGISFQLLHFRYEKHHFEKLGNTLFRQRGNRNAYRISAPLLGNEVILRESLLYSLGICSGLIHLVYGNDYGNACRLCMVYSLYRLRHDAVVCGNYENRDIRRFRAARTHSRKCRMTRCIKECDVLAVAVYSVCTDMLCDTACFARGDSRVSYRIKK